MLPDGMGNNSSGDSLHVPVPVSVCSISSPHAHRSTYLNSLVKKGFSKWLKPVHDMVLSVTSKAKECFGVCVDDALERSSVDSSVVEDEYVVCSDQSSDEDDTSVVASVVSDIFNLSEQTGNSNYYEFSSLASQEISHLREDLDHICRLSGTTGVDSIPFVAVGIFGEIHNFCVDSGAAVSILGEDFKSHINHRHLEKYPFTLTSANTTPVVVYGKITVPFTIGDKQFVHNFLLADVKRNFLGADFLSLHDIWLNVDRGLHIDKNIISHNTSNLVNNTILSHPDATNNVKGVNTVTFNDDDTSSSASSSVDRDTLDKLTKTFLDITPCDDHLLCGINNDTTTMSMETNDIIDDSTCADAQLLKKSVISKDLDPVAVHNQHCVDAKLCNDTLAYLRNKYSSVFSGEIALIAKHDIVMSIDVNGHFKRPYIYTVPYCYKEAVKERINELLTKGIIRRSCSEYMNPITVVPKKDGSVRVCGDYRALNAITRSDCFTLPRIDYIKSHIRGNVFTTLDLKDGFFQVPMHPDSAAKTAIYTEFGLYEFVRMPFGLKNAPAVFQRFIDMVFHDLKPFTHVYIDDVIIFSDTLTAHVKHIEIVIRRLSEYGLIVQERKCSFFMDRIQYLGYEFDIDGYRPLPRVLPQFNDYPIPTDKKAVQKFLGAVNFYRSHIPDLATLAAPLYDLLRKGVRFNWTTSCQKAFTLLCQSLSSRITLVPFRDRGEIVLQTDASSVALGAVLLQDGKPVEFYSRKLSNVEQRYPTYEREAAAMVSAMLHFRPFLIGRHFKLQTDHRPLLAWRNKMPETKRQARLWVKVQDLDYDIEYIPGEQNVLADFMSRPPGHEISPLSDLHNEVVLNGIALSLLTPELKKAQTDTFIASTNIAPSDLKFIDGFAYNIDKGYPRLIVPPEFRESFVSNIHTLGHFGRRRTLRSVAALYWWKGMPSYVAKFVKCCDVCQRNKPCKKLKRTPVKFFATARFKIIHMDFIGPFKSSKKGHNYLLTMMDRYSRWLEAIPMKDPTAQSCAQVFVSSWICRHGIPEAVLTDQGGHFESQLFNEVLSKLGITRMRTTAYHPQTNGALERAHGTLKNCLRCLVNQFHDWEERLPLALFAMRTALFDNDLSPSLILYGEQINVPGAFLEASPTLFDDDMSDFMSQLSFRMQEIRATILESQTPENIATDINNTNTNNEPLFKHSHAYLRDPIKRSTLEPKWLGPFKVLSSQGTVVRLNIDGTERNVNVDRLKPAYTLSGSFQIPMTESVKSDNSPSFLLPEGEFRPDLSDDEYVNDYQYAIDNQPVIPLTPLSPIQYESYPRRSERLKGTDVNYSK